MELEIGEQNYVIVLVKDSFLFSLALQYVLDPTDMSEFLGEKSLLFIFVLLRSLLFDEFNFFLVLFLMFFGDWENGLDFEAVLKLDLKLCVYVILENSLNLTERQEGLNLFIFREDILLLDLRKFGINYDDGLAKVLLALNFSKQEQSLFSGIALQGFGVDELPEVHYVA